VFPSIRLKGKKPHHDGRGQLKVDAKTAKPWTGPSPYLSNRPRHTMSRNAPLAWRHCQASQSLVESVRRLSCGCCSISARI